ncbi:MAG: hypothetical protein WAN46_00805 [Gammaproteobacteria bacterium]|jgi:predicted lipid-binding transport protein (Tim44 family)
MNEYIRISRDKAAAGFGWPERVVGGLLAVLMLLIALAFGVLILGVVAVGGLMLAVRVWWWRRRLRQSDSQKPVVIQGEYRVLESGRVGDKKG